MQKSLDEVSRQISNLATDVADLQQRVAHNEEMATTTVKSIVNHEGQLKFLQIKIEDFWDTRRQRRL